MIRTYVVEASADTNSAIASFLVAEIYKFAYADGKFMVEVREDDESKENFEAFLTFFQATSKEFTTAGDTPKEETKS